MFELAPKRSIAPEYLTVDPNQFFYQPFSSPLFFCETSNRIIDGCRDLSFFSKGLDNGRVHLHLNVNGVDVLATQI